MEKDLESKITEENKGAFIIRASGTFFPEEYLKNNGEEVEGDLSTEEYKGFIGTAISTIYDSLIDKAKNAKVDSVGLWLTFSEERTVESSMDVATLNIIKEYHKDINPIFEFAKMTLDSVYESPKDI